MINRTIAPAYKTIDQIDVLQTKMTKLSNGIPVYQLNAGSQEITKIEFIFRAGMYYQPATLIASGTNSMLETGTKNYTADQLSDGIDFFGSFLELQVEQDFATITVYSLNKYLSATLAYMEELIKYPTFPTDEFRIYFGNKKQKHAINSQKVSVLARRRFSELLFGESHPYGRDVKEADYDRVSVVELKEFFTKHYNSLNCTILTAGHLPADLQEDLEKHFGGSWGSQVHLIGSQPEQIVLNKGKHIVPKDDAIQSAIRIGRILFNKTHDDYFKFQVLNTILGGYFGSRLMANIREDKGYTYGIGSGITNLVRSGYFFISTEVGAEVTSATLDEIYKEIKKLRTDLISTEELETVRNYMLGNFLRSVDGPFTLIDKFKSIWEYNLDYSYFEKYFKAVKEVTPTELRDLANKYLQEEDLLECVAGKM